MNYKTVVEGKGGIVARIVADSVSEYGDRITTFELEYHRFIHSEVMTHRCLVGGTELHFDLPSGTQGEGYRLHKMTIEDFYNKWTEGSVLRKPSRYVEKDISNIDSDTVYTAKKLAELVGYASPSNIRKACRDGELDVKNPCKARHEDFLIKGSTFKTWASSPNYYRQDISDRLKKMNIRALDTPSGEVIHTNITDIWLVGEKETYRLVAGEYEITGTFDHPVLTDRGWVNLAEVTNKDCVVVVSSKQPTKTDPNLHKKVEGVWRNKWQNQMRDKLSLEQSGCCSVCKEEAKLEIHHIVPVCVDHSKCFDEDNIVAVCKDCHKEYHSEQGWQTGNPLSASYVAVDSVVPTGKTEKVYDLSVADRNHNFVANGIVVHNCFSRNAMSSRAVPVKTLINQVRENPAVPIHWGKNQAGMQASEEVVGKFTAYIDGIYFDTTPKDLWIEAAESAADYAEQMDNAKLHKQIVNRILEPFQMMKVVLTATEFDNFFWLRFDADAQPEIQELAKCMYEAMGQSKPELLRKGEWHTPYVEIWRDDSGGIMYGLEVEKGEESYPIRWLTAEDALAISASCCAQVSYRRLDNSYDKAMSVYERLGVGGGKIHASPFEHQATPIVECEWEFSLDGSEPSNLNMSEGITHGTRNGELWSGNLKGWIQYRQLLPNHTCYKYNTEV